MNKCSIENCSNKRYGKRTPKCRKHHELERMARGDILTMCSFNSCPNPARSHKLCPKHWRDLHPNRKPEEEKKVIHFGAKYSLSYVTWAQMKSRCLNTSNLGYKDYGGRGIIICERWLGKYGFMNFIDDMGEKPSPKHSINRINNDGNYEPSNCEWSTIHQQNTNRRSSSSHPGVQKVKGRNKMWCARLMVNGKDIYQEYFYNLEEAIKARQEAELKYLGYYTTKN